MAELRSRERVSGSPTKRSSTRARALSRAVRRTTPRRRYAGGAHSSLALCPRFSQLCKLANHPAQRPARDSPTERTALLGRCRGSRRAVGRLGIAIAARPGRPVEKPSESRQREHDEDCGKRAEPAECRVVLIHARNSTRWRGHLGGVPGTGPRRPPKMRKSATAAAGREPHKAAICEVLVL